jgi:nucleoside 2-deoxyribosyltransferase
MQPIVYLAGPVTGQTPQGAKGWRATAEGELYRYGIKAVSPVRDAPTLAHGETYSISYANEVIGGTPQAIRSKCKHDVRNCDALLAYMPRYGSRGDWPSVGTIIEITQAHMLGKAVILVTDEPRLAQHPILIGCVDAVFDDLQLGVAYAQSLLRVYAA